MALDRGSTFEAGYLIDATNGYPFTGYEDITFNAETSEIVRNGGNGAIAPVYGALPNGFGGTISWQFTEANQIALLTGGSVASGGITLNEEEEHTVAPVTFNFVLTNAATYIAASLGHGNVAYVTTGVTLTKVTGAPAPGEYRDTAGTLDFNAADVGKAIRVTYLSTNVTGKAVTVDPNDVPSKFEAYIVNKRLKMDGTSSTRTIYARNFTFTGGWNIIAKDGLITRDFRCSNSLPGDIVIYEG